MADKEKTRTRLIHLAGLERSLATSDRRLATGDRRPATTAAANQLNNNMSSQWGLESELSYPAARPLIWPPEQGRDGPLCARAPSG